MRIFGGLFIVQVLVDDKLKKSYKLIKTVKGALTDKSCEYLEDLHFSESLVQLVDLRLLIDLVEDLLELKRKLIVRTYAPAGIARSHLDFQKMTTGQHLIQQQLVIELGVQVEF